MRRMVAASVSVAILLVACSEPSPPSSLESPGSLESIQRLSAPTPGQVDLEGAGSPGPITVVIDGAHQVPATLVATGSGVSASFPSPVVGPQTVCVVEVCHRVAVTDPAAQTIAEAKAVAQQVLTTALERTGAPTAFPEWTFEVTGPMSGTGGSASADTQHVLIYANPGRTAADYELTVLHELGHVIDFSTVDDAARQAFSQWRGLGEAAHWCEGTSVLHGNARWSIPCEDFAEVMVWLATDGAHQPRSITQAGAPPLTDLDAFVAAFPQFAWWRAVATL